MNRRRILVVGTAEHLAKRELIRSMVENGIGRYEDCRLIESEIVEPGEIRPSRGKGKKRKQWELKS